ncbi:MAG: DUF3526 domain-containing protein [Pseudomonadota bacterium]
MNATLAVARDEWRYWRRSRLVLSVAVLFITILAIVSVTTAIRIHEDTHERTSHQADSEQTFLSQPDRHPHRMVHYGHYLFRAPVPLAVFDPGMDTVVGQAMFLEGHRQNSATFSESGDSADLGGLSWLTPAVVYQMFAPLLIIVVAHGAIVREREAGTLAPLLAQGIGGGTLIAGKALSLFSLTLLMLLPLLVSVLVSLGDGASPIAAASIVGVYLVYLSIWIALSLLVSAALRARSSIVASLAASWLVATLVLPAAAVNLTSWMLPLAGKIETELTMLTEVRDLSDGHDVDDSVYDHLQERLLEEYGVERVEDLSINIRGILAQMAEQELTDTLNIYAERRMAAEMRQTKLLEKFGWFTPALSVAVVSRTLAGTDLDHYHRFLRQAENVRINFVQGLNTAHAEELSYIDDINRNRDEASWQRARIDASNWDVLEAFNYEPADASVRLSNASTSIIVLFVWLIALVGLLSRAAARLTP